jgi:hypothetical protein
MASICTSTTTPTATTPRRRKPPSNGEGPPRTGAVKLAGLPLRWGPVPRVIAPLSGLLPDAKSQCAGSYRNPQASMFRAHQGVDLGAGELRPVRPHYLVSG